jgi:glycosyltransferase involved in cell wall biosynthesis
MKKFKLNILCEYFYPDLASTGQLMTELALELTRKGFEITVYTAKPTYVDNKDAPKYEILNGIIIHRVFYLNANKNTHFGRALRTLSFMASTFFSLLFSEENTLLFIISNPPLLCVVGILLKIIRSRKFIFIYEDVTPDVPIQINYMKADGIIAKIWDRINVYTIMKSEKIIVLSDDMKRLILGKLKKKTTLEIEKKVAIIHNWADNNFLKPLDKINNKFVLEHDLLNKFVVQYSGNFGLFNKFDTILHGAKNLQNENILFLFIGSGARKKDIENIIQEHNLLNVKLMNYLPYSMIPYSLTAADVSIISLQKNLNGMNMPSRLYSIMASGRPIIALVDKDSSVDNIIKEAKCGIRVDQDDVERFIEAIRFYKNNSQLAIEHGLNGRKYFENNFTLDLISQQYYNLFCKYN